MMPTRRRARTGAFALLWVALSVAIWNGFFDLYVSRGAREYLQLEAEFELGLGPAPVMSEVMSRAKHDGLVGATIWGTLVLAAGWGTLVVSGRGRSSTFQWPDAPRAPEATLER